MNVHYIDTFLNYIPELVFHEENLGETYLNFILMARINYNLGAT